MTTNLRLLMAGPWRTVAMRRHIDWAVESGIEVCVADINTPPHAIVPSSFQLIDLLPQDAKTIHRNRAHKDSQRATDSAVLRLHHVLRAFRPNVVHSYTLLQHTTVCLQAGTWPLVVSVWGFLNGLLTEESTIDERRWVRRLRRNARLLLVETPLLRDALSDRSIDPLQVECFPIGVDGSRFHPAYEQEAAAWRFVLNIPADATVLLSPRGWSLTYGQAHIMRAFAQALRQLEQPLFLVFLGMGRMGRPEVLAQEVLDLAVSLGVGHAVRWIPQVPYEAMPGVYALADIVVNYPRSDAFPSTLLEAAACARPVVTSALPTYRNTFIERFFRMVEPDNPAALADALVEVVVNGPTAWTANAHQARQAVLNQYEEHVQKQRLITLYQQLAQEHAPRRILASRSRFDENS